jgi:hypothetical protein
MPTPAVKLDQTFCAGVPLGQALAAQAPADACAACGEKLIETEGRDASWQASVAFWEISAVSHVELLCGACGEYLEQFFND